MKSETDEILDCTTGNMLLLKKYLCRLGKVNMFKFLFPAQLLFFTGILYESLTQCEKKVTRCHININVTVLEICSIQH